jgi:hypothetical protein
MGVALNLIVSPKLRLNSVSTSNQSILESLYQSTNLPLDRGISITLSKYVSLIKRSDLTSLSRLGKNNLSDILS